MEGMWGGECVREEYVRWERMNTGECVRQKKHKVGKHVHVMGLCLLLPLPSSLP